jgi:hypothetical protein
MDTSADFLRFVTQAAEDAVTFDGDAAAIASRAREGDKDAVAELTRAYAAMAVAFRRKRHSRRFAASSGSRRWWPPVFA